MQHFYEVLHKFHQRDENPPQKAQRYIEVWMLLGIKFSDLQLIFTSCVHLPGALEELFQKLKKTFELASFVVPKGFDTKVMLEYTAMYFKVCYFTISSLFVNFLLMTLPYWNVKTRQTKLVIPLGKVIAKNMFTPIK